MGRLSSGASATRGAASAGAAGSSAGSSSGAAPGSSAGTSSGASSAGACSVSATPARSSAGTCPGSSAAGSGASSPRRRSTSRLGSVKPADGFTSGSRLKGASGPRGTAARPPVVAGRTLTCAGTSSSKLNSFAASSETTMNIPGCETRPTTMTSTDCPVCGFVTLTTLFRSKLFEAAYNPSRGN